MIVATTPYIAGYRVAGKTGTTHIAAGGSYDRRRYLATFAGFAPVSNPRLVLLVSLRDPQGSAYYGGEVVGYKVGATNEAAQTQGVLYQTLAARRVRGRPVLDRVLQDIKERRDGYKSKK